MRLETTLLNTVQKDKKNYWGCKMKNYILWVGGVDDYYNNLTSAENAKKEWVANGYDDVVIEEVEI